MNIVLIGATGMVGSRLLREASGRQHRVTAVARSIDALAPLPGVVPFCCDTADVSALTHIIAGHDLVLTAVKWNSSNIEHLLRAARAAGTRRCLFVVGAGSLLRDDGRLHFDHMAERGIMPPTSRPAILALERLRQVEDLDWTAMSPAGDIQPGVRTGEFRLGRDHLVVDREGHSRISCEDFAVAILNECEHPRFIRARFTVAY